MFILFNGPPRSGKDTAAKFAFDYITNMKSFREHPIAAKWEKFSRPNKEAFAKTIGADIDWMFNVAGFEEKKEQVIPVYGVSYRQWQIDFSEKFMKPLYGKDIFGELLYQRTKRHINDRAVRWVVIVSDCGFQIEVDALKDCDVLLLTIQRQGCTFAGDSREYVKPANGWDHSIINNDRSLDDLRAGIEHVVGGWLDFFT